MTASPEPGWMQVFVGPEMDLTLGAALKKRCSRKGVIFHFKIPNEHRTLGGEFLN